ncbi:MAG: bifunctional homocysteine S-methyltransferase/methylenetetrahydrofolate reductase [Thermoanaerobaculaceae bacterium]|nr:bifunctional homocysteine S-methyltransferase/methylenetetrahydrofolate reductase [Thermoanaerobaculaceae bacterium]TAM46113.1 MAG: bifunctional homocysteine S-methyltransferase/methylenetetrahydrofolate reductase [Acidobacteriota bacterium]
MNPAATAARFADHVVVADGAMGSELFAALPEGTHLDLAPLEHPRRVLDIHLAYLAAGAELIETATFAASRPRLARLHAGDQVEAVNSAGVKLAREAREIAGTDCLVAGSIGPLAGVIDLDEPAGPAAIAAAHAEQAAILAGRGADLLVLETFFRLDELLLAIAAVRGVTKVPVVAMLTFPYDKLPESHPEIAAALRELFAHEPLAAGINCALGPQGTLDVLEALGEVPGLLAVMPNAGSLLRRDGRIIRPPTTPNYFGGFARRAAELGAAIVGGCCGTGPEHIRAVAEALKGVRPVPARSPRVAVAAPAPPPRLQARPASGLAAKLGAREFVRVVQLDPPRGTNSDRIVEAARALAATGRVDALDINSNPLARLRMDSLWLAAEVQRAAGIETIPHITPRDTSLMGLQAQLLGAWRAGIRNLLAISGDPSQLGDYPGVHDVYHVDIFELVRSVSRMAEGFDCAGNPIGEPPAYCLGVAVNPAADDLGHEVDRLRRKADAGAHFVMSQVFFSWQPWERLLDRCGGALPLPALVAVWPLPSFRLALRLNNEVPGIVVPDELLRRLEHAGAAAAKVGREVALEMLRGAPERAAGVYLVAPFKNPAEVVELLDE